LALGERRANAARDFLTSLGISGDRIRTISYGEERPADPASNEAAWSKNRRDEFKLFK
jgi:peptidoglycan-associated lipoprotein